MMVRSDNSTVAKVVLDVDTVELGGVGAGFVPGMSPADADAESVSVKQIANVRFLMVRVSPAVSSWENAGFYH